MSARTITLGCRLNFAESEAMRALAGDDAIIVNSCAVTNEAVRQTRQAIRRAHRESPEKRIIVTVHEGSVLLTGATGYVGGAAGAGTRR